MTVDVNHLPPCGCAHECQSVSYTICRDARGRMTPRQIALARHALGLHASCLVSRRNAAISHPERDDFVEWERMVADGTAVKGRAVEGTEWGMLDGSRIFHLTRSGAEAVLLPGERLDPEDWSAIGGENG